MSTSKGLEGIIVAETDITSIEEGKLSYVGYNIDDLADFATFEEVIYLLWHKQLPSEEELHKLKTQLFEEMTLESSFIEQLRYMVVDEAHPMDVLRTAVSLLSLYDSIHDPEDTVANINRAIRIQAKLAMIITSFNRLRNNQPLVKPMSNLSYAENFLYMLHGNEVEPLESEAFNKALVLHADHELNASTFTARVCVATLSDLYSGLTAAISALKGPLHGGANEQVIKMLMDIKEVESAIPYVKEKMANKEKIMGMGHRVYKQGDPRAKHLKNMSKQITQLKGMPEWYEMSEKIEAFVKEEKGLPANVDFYSASMYHALGIPHDLFTPIFAMSRTSGWVAHMLEQYANNRLIRPRAEYVGKENQTYQPVNER
ncbi:citrate synthase 2 [Halolactibacillus alkaliphilus]|uniref:Citrate synthase n=1 Tax=Halolactibacillus alkaliphilus TaxID=442899 RepID=A0A511X2Y2_9BACI|nr:citrate/2-methylcitrate synthase [Halolactibacillus alkaliphilus]GEN57319.1 citrate synthase 2 [Halolactibacillus alkaliphilus]GGN72855.1 citrate synthase 2 [Halolactibacillus alkaliphilus]SFO93325.1 citrate synthase [Halolactibacillus alkaliphilus]